MAFITFVLITLISSKYCNALPAAQVAQLDDGVSPLTITNQTAPAQVFNFDASTPDPPARIQGEATKKEINHNFLRHGSSGQNETQVAAAAQANTARLKKRDTADTNWYHGIRGSMRSTQGPNMYSIEGVDQIQIVQLTQKAAADARTRWAQDEGWFEPSNFYNYTLGPYTLAAMAFFETAHTTDGDEPFSYSDFATVADFVHNITTSDMASNQSIVGTITNPAGKAVVDFAVLWNWKDVEVSAAEVQQKAHEASTQAVAATSNGVGGRRRLVRRDDTAPIRVNIATTGFYWLMHESRTQLKAFLMESIISGCHTNMGFDCNGERITNAITEWWHLDNFLADVVENGFSLMLNPGAAIKPFLLRIAVRALLTWAHVVGWSMELDEVSARYGELYDPQGKVIGRWSWGTSLAEAFNFIVVEPTGPTDHYAGITVRVRDEL